MRTYSLPSGNLLHSVKPHDTPVSVIESDSTSTLVATGGAEGFVKVWDVEGGYMTHFLKGHGGLVSALKFWGGKVGKWRLASGSEDCKIRIWDLVKKRYILLRWSRVDGSCIAVLENHVSVIRGLDFSRDGETLISGSRDQVVNYWDMKSFKLKTTLPVYEVRSEGRCADVLVYRNSGIPFKFKNG
jgi:U3 small nucleolar RNA-associated protein 13